MNKLQQLPLFDTDTLPTSNILPNTSNLMADDDKAIHRWYRFVLSFPPHLVRHYLTEFNTRKGDTVLDPFCGTGTTVVESKLHGLQGIGFEANPFPHFASSVKVDWAINYKELVTVATSVADIAHDEMRRQGIDETKRQKIFTKDMPLRSLPTETQKLLITNSISPLPLHKVLILLDSLKLFSTHRVYNHLLLALGNSLVTHISNLRFGPEVGIGKCKDDVLVIPYWLSEVQRIASDLQYTIGQNYAKAEIHLTDARQIENFLQPESIDAVITSPPYPNEKDYTRTTRLESVLLGFYKTRTDLREIKKTLLRSNTRGVYSVDNDDLWVQHIQEIQVLADMIETRRIELGKTSGFERLYARLTRLYFGGMARHLAELRTYLRPGAHLAYVVGDQASYFRVMIRTGKLLAIIAQDLGYELIRIDIFRTRFATATQTNLNEEVVVLRWPG